MDGLAEVAQKGGFIIPGNHDIGVQEFKIPGLIDLAYRKVDRTAFGLGLSFYGVPLTTCYDMPSLATVWDHMTSNREAEAAAFDFEAVDVVVSHGPPAGILDNAGYDLVLQRSCNIGSGRLRDYIQRHSPKFVICGHVHEAAGVELYRDSFESPPTWVYNVARRAVLIDTDYPGEWEVVIGREE